MEELTGPWLPHCSGLPRRAVSVRPKLGRKERGGKGPGNPDAYVSTSPSTLAVHRVCVCVYSPDLLEPHILRSLSNVKITSVHTACCACHFIALDVHGAAWMFGRSAHCALGVVGTDVIPENAPRRVLPTDLGANEGTRFVHAACGRSHSLLVDSDGRVWSTGANNFGQVGVCPSVVRAGLVMLGFRSVDIL